MRRSVKRQRFVVPFANNTQENIQRNYQPVTIPASAGNVVAKEQLSSERNFPVPSASTKRSINDILDLIDDEDEEVKPEKETVKVNTVTEFRAPCEHVEKMQLMTKAAINSLAVPDTPISSFDEDEAVVAENDCDTMVPVAGEITSVSTSEEIFNMNNVGKDKQLSEFTSYFNVVWCKRSAKKHKKWEGDAILIVKSRSAVLKDMDGKVIARGVGYKIKEVTSLEEGSKFYIGGKECEIQCQIPEKEYLSGKCFQSCSADSSLAP